MSVQLITEKGRETVNPAFYGEVTAKSKAHLARCYQCVACSSGCPSAYQMDYPPHQLLRMVQLGLKERVLNSNTFWICLSCETCATRCPNGIEIVLVMDTLRDMALAEKRKNSTRLPLFHKTFIGDIVLFGRIYELGLILWYTIFSGNIFRLKGLARDAVLGVKMFTRGKLAIFPHRIKGQKAVKRIYEMTGKTG
jgi:heterodisulfide reductase subunit C